MSSVIPKDLTGLVRDPTKLDAWIKGERGTSLNNLCNEITLPMIGVDTSDNLCTLGLKESFITFAGLMLVFQLRTHVKVRELSGLSPIQGYPTNVVDPDAESLALKLLREHAEDLTWLDNSLGAIIIRRQEQTKLFSSLAVNNSLKEQRLMQATNSVLSKSGPGYVDPHHPDANHSGEAELRGGSKVPAFHGDIPMNFKLKDGGFKPGDLSSIGTATSDDVSKLGSLLESVDGCKALVKHPKLKSLDQVRKPKRKKSKPKSAHIPNMNNHSVKRALGATILMKLGQVQRDTMDSYKRAMLKELPAADLLEMATGEKLPDYQANLINNMQVKADPTAPVVERMGSYYKESISDDAPVNEELNTLLEVSSEVIELGRGLTNAIVYYDDGVELTNAQRQTLLEAREEGTDILLADGNTIKFTLDADDPDPLATIEQIQKIYLTEDEYTTDVYAAKHLATASAARFSQGKSEICFFGGVDRKDISLTKGDQSILIHYEDLTGAVINLVGCEIGTLESIICNLDFWMELRKDLCGEILPHLDNYFETISTEDLHARVQDYCVRLTVGYVANNA